MGRRDAVPAADDPKLPKAPPPRPPPPSDIKTKEDIRGKPRKLI
jgi:hypothetical protein